MPETKSETDIKSSRLDDSRERIEDDDEEGQIKESPPKSGVHSPNVDGDKGNSHSHRRHGKDAKHRYKSRDKDRDHKSSKHSHRDKDKRRHHDKDDPSEHKRNRDRDTGPDEPKSKRQREEDPDKKLSSHHRDNRAGDRDHARSDRGDARRDDRDKDKRRDRGTDDRDRDRDDRGKVRNDYRTQERGHRDDRGAAKSQRVTERARPLERSGRDNSAHDRSHALEHGSGAGKQGNGGDHVSRRRDQSVREGVASKPSESARDVRPPAENEPERKTLLSLEELLKKKKEADVEAARPKFKTKKQREEEALQRRAEEASGSAAQVAMVRESLQQQQRQEPVGRAERQQAHMSQKEAQMTHDLIRAQYLGTVKTKRRVCKANEKFRFNFDWDAKDDTSKDANPLYERKQDGGVLFGRGMLAGVDRRTQMKGAAEREQVKLQKMRLARGETATLADMEADSQRLARAEKGEYDVVKTQTHWSEKERSDMLQRDWRIFREDHRISYKNAGKDAPNAYRTWDEMNLPSEINLAIADLGYEKPSPIQMASIPFGIRQRDVVGLAETGSGKTAAFVIPMIIYIMMQPVMNELNCVEGPYSLVLAPTRELAQQIDAEARVLMKYTEFKTACVVGGLAYEEQAAKLRRGVEMLVATPGRLVDCLQRRYAVLNQCNYIVLDEADRMIDLGFEQPVTEIMEAMPSSNLKPEDEEVVLEADRTYRTTYMFSATMPLQVERIAKRYLRRPVTVTVGSAGRATDNVTQRVLWMKENDKPRRLTSELDSFQASNAKEADFTDPTKARSFKVIVFVNNKVHSEEVYNTLAATEKYKCALLHGGKAQEQREEAIAGFRAGQFDIMIATDVAGRGIDVPDVGMVLNYDMPHTISNYTHRIGRTGRAGRTGVAVTFLTVKNEEVFYDLREMLESSKASIPSELARHESAKVKPGAFSDGPSRKDTVLYAS